MAYKPRYSKRFAKAFKSLAPAERKRAFAALERLKEEPFPEGKAFKRIQGLKDEFFRLRVGDYRIIYSVKGEYLDIEDLVHRSELEKAIKRLQP